jgi:hypothetical protein
MRSNSFRLAFSGENRARRIYLRVQEDQKAQFAPPVKTLVLPSLPVAVSGAPGASASASAALTRNAVKHIGLDGGGWLSLSNFGLLYLARSVLQSALVFIKSSRSGLIG